MQIYAEYALLENFCMDFTLLFTAKTASRNPARYPRLVIASVLGACFAVAFPLFNLKGAAAIAVKLVSGAAMCAASGKFQSLKGFLKFTAVFAAATFVVGGALTAAMMLGGISLAGGEGYILSSVPVGIPLFTATLVAIAAHRIRGKFTRAKQTNAQCRIYLNNKCAQGNAFYDSGNKVYYDGSPVTVVPPHLACMLVDTTGIKNFVDIHTVAGKGKMAVFTAEKIEIDDGKKTIMRQNVTIGVSPRHIKKIVLHPDLSEVI